MKIQTAVAIAVAALAIGIPTAAATPDGYQPQLQGGAPDAVDRYLRNHTSSAVLDATGAAAHPDSRADRSIPVGQVAVRAAAGRDWTTGALGALSGALFVLLAVVGAFAMRERRRLVLR